MPEPSGLSWSVISSMEIMADGQNITTHCDIKRSVFEMHAGPLAGTAKVYVRDLGHDLAIATGSEITLDIENLRVWGGYVMSITREYAFPVDDTSVPAETPRYFVLDCSDYNILFSKRFIRNKANATKRVPKYAAGRHDDEIVLDLFHNYLDLEGDGLTHSKVTYVGTPQEDNPGSPAVPAMSWGTAMRNTAMLPGAIYYIDADKTLNYADVDIPDAPFVLTDEPTVFTPGGGSSDVITDDFSRTVEDEWGTSGRAAWFESNDYYAGATYRVDGSTGTMSPNGAQGYTIASWGSAAKWTQSIRIWIPVTVSGGSRSVGMSFDDSPTMNIEVGFQVTAISQTDAQVMIWWYDLSDFGEEEITLTGSGWNWAGGGGFWSTMVLEAEAEIGVRGKWWKDGSNEPDWQASAACTSPDLIPALEMPSVWANATSTSSPWKFDDYRIEAITGNPAPPIFETVGVGYREMSIIEDGTMLANDAFVWGTGLGQDQMTFRRYEAAPSQAEHGLWQWADYRQDLYRPQSVLKRATTYVDGSTQNNRGHKNPAVTIRCTVVQPGLRAGMKVHFVCGIHGFDDVIPIRSIHIRFVNNTEAMFDLVLAHYLDEAWNTAEFPPLAEPGPTGHCETLTPVGNEVTTSDPYVAGTVTVYRDDGVPVASVEEDPSTGLVSFTQPDPPLTSVIVCYAAYDTRYCETPTGIPSGGMFETFTRTIAGEWGTSDVGCPWDNYESYPFISSPSVNGTQGVIRRSYAEPVISGTQTYIVADSPYFDGPWNPEFFSSFTLITRFTFNAISDCTNEWTYFGVKDGTGFHGPSDGISIRTNSTVGNEGLDLVDGYNDIHVAFSWQTGTPYLLKWERTWGGTSRVKCWVESNGEPETWTMSGTAPTSYEETPTFSFFTQAGGTVDTDYELVFDYLDFDPVGHGEAAAHKVTHAYGPGTLSATAVDGSHVTITEIDPTLGTFTYDPHVDIIVCYLGPGSVGGDPPGGYGGGPVYRPRHVRQLGWGSPLDGSNCTMASACIALDRHTLGANTSTPPHMRSHQDDQTGGTDLNDAAVAFMRGWSEYLDVHYGDSWSTFVSSVNGGRGAILQGTYSRITAEYSSQPSFDGSHAMYVNEFNSSGYALVYDPLATGPRWMPAEMLRDYAETFTGGSCSAAYTQVTA